MAEKRDVTPAGAGAPPAGGEGGAAEREAIEDWRRRIDAIDTQLMSLLNSRSACAVEIGRIKRALGLPVYSPEREAWILDRVARENPGPLDDTAVRRVFERIIDESRRLERIASEAEQAEGGPNPGRESEKTWSS
jgi:chorismate mutase